MKIISINAGSSSLKFSLFDMSDESIIASGNFERIGMEGSCCNIKYNGQKIAQEIPMNNHTEAVKILMDKLVDLEIIRSLDDIDGVGHRIVHGGNIYNKSVLITDKVISDIEDCVKYAPLHNPSHLLGIRAFKEALPNVVMTAVFDTAFHQTMDEVEYLYPVPYYWYSDYSVRKYGAHGTSHNYITQSVKEILGRDNFRLICCHIGNGASICAIKDMKCVDTSMGFTPLAGVMMGTRSGDVDPSIIPYVMEKEGKNVGEVLDDLNKNSGMLGLSGYSNDLRDINEKCDEGDHRAIVARDKYVRRIVDYISQYYVLLGGCDIIVFTAGVGENNIPIRREVCERLSCLGVKIDLDKNNVRAETAKISANDSKVDVYVIPTNEELMIARDTLEIIKNR